MSENTNSQHSRLDLVEDEVFPFFVRNNLSPTDNDAETLTGNAFLYEGGYICTSAVADELLEKIRISGEHKEAQSEHHVPLTPSVDLPPSPSPSPSPTAVSSGAHPPTPSAPINTSDHTALLNRLNKPPHIVPFHGATLDRNERLKIIAAIAICESGHDPFTAVNADSEFNSMPSASISYGHIVHIGLSYGIIQFTQDSGSLGKLLVKMRAKDAAKFIEIFGDNWEQLITLTTTGLQVPGVDYASGQAHWNAIRHTALGQQLRNLALHHNLPVGSEIRGRRVRPIPVSIGGARQDLWQGVWRQRFIEAGKVDVFQEAELEFAVEGYMNPVLPFCRQNNVRSALGLAFISACAIRGANKRLLAASAAVVGDEVPFQSGASERRAVQHIANLHPNQINYLGNIAVQRDEIIRAKKLLQDETGLLVEDFYDLASYGVDCDH